MHVVKGYILGAARFSIRLVKLNWSHMCYKILQSSGCKPSSCHLPSSKSSNQCSQVSSGVQICAQRIGSYYTSQKRKGSKYQVGIGINNAAGIKLLWTMTETNSLWSTYIRNLYLGTDGNILKASGTWKFLIHSRDKAMGIILLNDNDNPVWLPSTSHNLKFFWNFIRERAPLSNTYKSVWFPNNCPKKSLCLLRAAKDILSTKRLPH